MQLDELTQQNAALVEQASAASQTMAEQARGLNDSMQRFRVKSTGAAATTPSDEGAATPARSAASQSAIERRKAGRPWSGPKNEAAAPVRKLAAGNAAAGDESDWKEF